MKFSEFYNIEVNESEDWYDIVLSIDLKFFIDPFLIYAYEFDPFKGSHDEIITFFDEVFKLIAKSSGNNKSYLWKRAENLLLFPEADEFCLGFTSSGTKGAGSGVGFSKIIASALWETVQAGIKNITHFEEVGLFKEGIGADRVSDITATLLKHRFSVYTKEICDRLGVPTRPRMYHRGKFDRNSTRWSVASFDLPLNPYNERPILLAPKKYIRDLPTINADDFWDYCYENENETIRNDFGADIVKNVNKSTIISFAARHPAIRAQYIAFTESESPTPYDFSKDPKGFHLWYDSSAEFCKNNPLTVDISSNEDFKKTIFSFVDEFRGYVENNSGWKLLWNNKKSPRSEEAAQLLFLGIIKHYCKANNIDISRESDIGRGPVDFKVSRGYLFRALLELKLAKNTKFWSGLKKQLLKYLEVEAIEIGYFIVVVYSEKDIYRVREIQKAVAEINTKTKYDISAIVVDARVDPPSASKL